MLTLTKQSKTGAGLKNRAGLFCFELW